MRSKWATWRAVEVSLRPRSPLDLAKGVPRSILPVPIKPFGSLFGIILKTLETKTASINKVCFRCTFGIEFWYKNVRFWYQIRAGEWSYFSISSEMRKVDFWTTVHVFWRFLLFSTTLGSRELEAKINFETQLEKDINLALIFSWFWSQKSSEIGSKID